MGATIREAVLERSGFERGARPATPQEALRVIQLWGLSIGDLVGQISSVASSLAGRASRSHTGDQLEVRQRRSVAALSTAGRETYYEMLLSVQQESFWRDHFSDQTVFVFPVTTPGAASASTGGRAHRYRGTHEMDTVTSSSGQTYPVHIISIAREVFEPDPGTVPRSARRSSDERRQQAVSILVHELSHGIYGPSMLRRSMRPFLQDLAVLLADHPRISALRSGVADAERARQDHIANIRQILFERTAYAESEVFVHLQQLTHVPSEDVDLIRGSVDIYLEQLLRIGLPHGVLAGILRSLSRRVRSVYDQRIAAAPEDSDQRSRLQRHKERAMEMLVHVLSQVEARLREESSDSEPR